MREDGRLFAGLPGILSMNSWLFTFFCMAKTDGCTVTLIDWTEWPTIGVLLARSWQSVARLPTGGEVHAGVSQ